MGYSVEYGHKYLPNSENTVEDIFVFLYHRFGNRWKALCMSSEGHVFGEYVVDGLVDACDQFGALRYKDNPVLHDIISEMYPSGYRICIVPHQMAVSFAPLQDALQRKARLGLAKVLGRQENAPVPVAGGPVAVTATDPPCISAMDDVEPFTFDYVNYKGEPSSRKVIPIKVSFDRSEWHPEPQWMLHAWDVEKEAYRDFAMKDMYRVNFFGL